MIGDDGFMQRYKSYNRRLEHCPSIATDIYGAPVTQHTRKPPHRAVYHGLPNKNKCSFNKVTQRITSILQILHTTDRALRHFGSWVRPVLVSSYRQMTTVHSIEL